MKEYIKPELEVMDFDFADVIVTSGNDETIKIKSSYYASGDAYDANNPELNDPFWSK